jgi:hypothetical protein
MASATFDEGATGMMNASSGAGGHNGSTTATQLQARTGLQFAKRRSTVLRRYVNE